MDFAKLENIRRTYAHKVKVGWGVAGGLMVLTATLILILTATQSTMGGGGPSISGFDILISLAPSIFIAVLAAIIIRIFTYKDALKYRRAYKAYFVERILNQTFTVLTYRHEMGISVSVLENTGMMNTGDRYHSNDLVLGKYKNVRFAQADVEIEEEVTDSDGDTTYETIFRGRWMVFEFLKQFNFRMGVTSRKFSAGMVKRNRKAAKKFQRINVESNDFNRKYRIYAEDGFEAFYLLDPAFIDKIEKLGDELEKPFILCFVNNQLQVGLNDGRDSFEPPSPLVPLDEKVETEKIARDIKVITDFVDALSLDKRLFEAKK